MYSLLLMTVMAGSGDTAAFGGKFLNRGGCNGSCTGVVVHYASCSGSCTGSSCLGSSCHGSSCHGSSCHGSSCHGSSCHGSSCYGGRLGFFRKHSSCHGCTGSSCSGYTTGCSGCVGSAPMMSAPEAAPAPTTPAAPATPMPMGKVGMNANITVELPVGATLKVDGVVVAGEGSIRLFHTPELAAGQQYFYDMTAEVNVAGKIEVQTRRVVVTAGSAITASFETLATVAAK